MVDDVTVCIPTFPGREAYADRARESAAEQARVLVHTDSYLPQSRARAYVTWWEAIYRASTPYVVLLYDDDWLEPTFAETTREVMQDGVAYAFTNATVRAPDGMAAPNLDWPEPSGYAASGDMIDRFLRMPLTVSPSCCLFRREDALSCLLAGGVPLSDGGSVANAGADLLLTLLPLLKYPHVAWIRQPLANLDAGPQSTTISTIQTEAGREELLAAYADARRFFRALRGGLCELQ